MGAHFADQEAKRDAAVKKHEAHRLAMLERFNVDERGQIFEAVKNGSEADKALVTEYIEREASSIPFGNINELIAFLKKVFSEHSDWAMGEEVNAVMEASDILEFKIECKINGQDTRVKIKLQNIIGVGENAGKQTTRVYEVKELEDLNKPVPVKPPPKTSLLRELFNKMK
ncbi:MAG: hypothetical protein ACD_72C00405G0002 [uncultured bacterium]|nr:MAG: hypothetical protein ACD_72C00405G0002 [uncultured bacterium]